MYILVFLMIPQEKLTPGTVLLFLTFLINSVAGEEDKQPQTLTDNLC